MSAPIYNQDWTSFSEKKDIWPFERYDKALDSVAIRFSEKSEWETSPILEPVDMTGAGLQSLSPQLKLSMDRVSLLTQTGLTDEELGFAVHATDSAMKRTHPVFSGSMAGIEEDANIQISTLLLSQLSLRRGLVLGVVAYSKVSKNGYDLGDRIAAKEFIIRAPAEVSVSFPINKMDPDDEKWPIDKYSRDTAWFIWWGERTSVFDYDAPMESVMRVVFNEKVHDNLHRLQKKGDTAHKMFWSQVSADIFLEVTSVYLSSGEIDEPEDSNNGFRAKFMRSLKKLWLKTPGNSKASCAELVKQFKEDPDFLSKLRAVIQQRANIRRLAESIPA
jgi:hypothetical protein